MRVIGHRGACGYAPENTPESYELAVKMGVDEVEGDFQVVSTGEAIGMHNDTIDATTDGSGAVAGLSFEELRNLNAGHGQAPPTLDEAVGIIVVRGDTAINVDAKGGGFARPFAGIISSYVEQGYSSDYFRVSSVNQRELARFCRLLPYVHTGVIYPENPGRFWRYAEAHHTTFVTLNASFVTERHVAQAHEVGLEVRAFTVNDEIEARRMEDMGVDAIFSNYPDRVRAGIGQAATKALVPQQSRLQHAEWAAAV